MSENITIVNSDSFSEEVLQAKLPVLVDFWADWCGPCRMLTPILEAVAKEYAGKVKVVKINVDDSGDIASAYDVRAIPKLALFKDGKVAADKVGALTKIQLVDFLEDHL